MRSARTHHPGRRLAGVAARITRPLLVLVWSLLGLSAWGAATAMAQPLIQQVSTDAGVTVAVPAALRPATGLAALPDMPLQVAGLATFSDDDERPLSLQVRTGDPHGWTSLPADDAATVAEWTQRFAAELQLPEAYDFKPGRYEPERGALSLQYKVVGPSSARLMQRLPDAHPFWAPTLEAGESPKLSKCVLEALLGGQPSATESELDARLVAAAQTCSLPEALVGGYLQQLGAAEFAPAITTVTYLAFFTSSGTIATLIMAPLDRQQAVDDAAAVVWQGTEVAEDARLPVAAASRAIWFCELAAIVFGSFLAVFLLGGTLAWVLARLGVRAPLAVGASLGMLSALALVALLRAGALNWANGVQVSSYLLASALAFRPLVRWLSTRGGSLLRRVRGLRGTRGLTTVEYVVVLVIVACVALGAWHLFGGSVKKALSNGTEQLDGLGEVALGDSPRNLDGSRARTGRNGSEPADRAGGAAVPGARSERGDGSRNGSPSNGSPGNGSPGNGSRGNGSSGNGSSGNGSPSNGSGGPARRGTAPDGARAQALDSASGGARPETRGSAAQGAAESALQAMLPPRVVPTTAPPMPLPPNAGKVLASEAKGPSTLLRGTDIVTDFVPYLSNVKDATIAITGVNPVTKEHVGTVGRVIAGVFAIPAAGNVLKYVGKGGKYVLKGGKAAYEAFEVARAGSKIEKAVAKNVEREIAERAEKELAERAEKEAAARAEREATARAEQTAAGTASEELAKGEGTLLSKVTCFPPGTLVLMADGGTRAIEKVRAGDWVIAANPETGSEPVIRQVIGTTRSQTKRLFSVEFDADWDGLADGVFEATGQHPIWTQNSGWRNARDLQVGDLLESSDGAALEVLSQTEKPGLSATFNLSVADIHTFFIVADGVPILVHNTPRIHGVAPDWAVKGAHVTASNGIEVSIHGSGKDIKIGPVFSRDVGKAETEKAIKETAEALKNPSWRAKLLEQTRKATAYLGKGSQVERAGSGGTRALEVTLERWCK